MKTASHILLALLVTGCVSADLSKDGPDETTVVNTTDDRTSAYSQDDKDEPSDENTTGNNEAGQNNEESPGVCGDGVIDPGEACDGAVADTCADLGFDGGTVACVDCQIDTTQCTRATCGDGVVQADEVCDDGADNGTYDHCSANCSRIGAMCGDGVTNGPESCDGADIDVTCTSLGFDGGSLGCSTTCGYDTSGCETWSCGNGIIEGSEVCDDGASNGSYGACNSTCDGLAAHCGDGVRNGPEQCDGSDVGGATCSSAGFGRGDVTCTSTCELDGAMCSQAPGAGEVLVTEIMQNPQFSLDSDGEWFELHNNTGRSIDLQGCTVESGTVSGPESFDIDEELVLPAGAYAVFARSANAPMTTDYVYGTAINLNNSFDYVTLYCPDPYGGSDIAVDTVTYDDGQTFPDPEGSSMSLSPNAFHQGLNDSGSNWCESVSTFGVGDRGTPGAPNDPC